MRTWTDGLAEALTMVHEPIKAQQLIRRYRDAFPIAYREAYVPATTVADIRLVESLSPIRPLGADFYSRREGAHAGAGLKVWSREKPIALSERVPVLENMGFKVVDERTYRVEPDEAGAAEVWLHDMLLERADGAAFDIEALKARLEAAFMAVMRARAENDGYNALVLSAGLQWRDVALIRTISRYLRQVRVAYSQDYMWGTLRRHPEIAAQVAQMFHTRFDPRLELSIEERGAKQAEFVAAIETALGAVESLDEDRILRHFVNAVASALRTNFYQTENGQPKPTIAIKFDSRKIDGLPLPKPLYEIFVYSPRVEGVHLRFGKVARGGIRWSDRPQDFRTEVLGLVKAQQVKNAVIVPVGAKGGFVPKQLPAGPREAIQAEGTAAYTVFISSLLDVSDNLGPDGVIPPENVIRYDNDDPYLVVAADKGTATFSDTANRIAIEHGFWLGDAFASGGSAGYDHKKMGITARGAWEAVRRHFREMDVDITTTPFTVAGVGDMSGDVFGNGMLREQTIKLVAAFDHRDIFIDPITRSGTQLQRTAAAVRSLALELAGLQQGLSLGRRRHLFAQGEGNHAQRRGAGAARTCREGHAAAGDDRDPQAQHRPSVVRRHRDLYPRRDRNRRSGRRPRQRPDPRHGRDASLQGGRRGRQSRRHSEGPHRSRDARRAAEHRRDRQFGRRQHLRRRGQHQDRADAGDAGWPALARSARQASR